MGIDVLVIPDHLIPQLAPVPAMASIAAATAPSWSARSGSSRPSSSGWQARRGCVLGLLDRRASCYNVAERRTSWT
ncbi:MAG: hypothetical protein H0U86_04810 [Chloroflexi bacterium]|nr:hypothetical protein [Chloroflexota bacterium]